MDLNDYQELMKDVQTLVPMVSMLIKQSKDLINTNEELKNELALHKVIEKKEFDIIDQVHKMKILNDSLIYAIQTDDAMANDIINAAEEDGNGKIVDFWKSRKGDYESMF